MVVDDIDYNRFALSEIMDSIGLKCEEAVNGKNCIDKVEAMDKKLCCKGIRLIIMDYDMPVMTGLEVRSNI